MFKTFDRIREQTISGGTGNLTLTAYADNYLRFSNVLNSGTRFPYAVVDSTAFEVGVGYLNSSGELVRESVLSSTSYSSGPVFSSVNFTAGTTKDVFLPAPSAITPTLTQNPSGSYQDAQFLIYDLNNAQDNREWQIKSLGQISLNSGSFPNNAVVYVESGKLRGHPSFTYSSGSSNSLNLNGNFFVEGNISAAHKEFVINHPLKPNYKLIHGCLEGPEHGIYYRKTIVCKKQIEIIIPDYFLALSRNFSVLINTKDGSRASWDISGNKLIVKRKGWLLKETKVSIMIIAERTDGVFTLERGPLYEVA